MEQVKIEIDGQLLLALQKLHECHVIYFNTMAKYDNEKTLDNFATHCDCVSHIIKEKIANDINCKIEIAVNEKYDKPII